MSSRGHKRKSTAADIDENGSVHSEDTEVDDLVAGDLESRESEKSEVPASQHPRFVLKELDSEDALIAALQQRISYQVHRLQIEESLLEAQIAEIERMHMSGQPFSIQEIRERAIAQLRSQLASMAPPPAPFQSEPQPPVETQPPQVAPASSAPAEPSGVGLGLSIVPPSLDFTAMEVSTMPAMGSGSGSIALAPISRARLQTAAEEEEEEEDSDDDIVVVPEQQLPRSLVGRNGGGGGSSTSGPSRFRAGVELEEKRRQHHAQQKDTYAERVFQSSEAAGRLGAEIGASLGLDMSKDIEKDMSNPFAAKPATNGTNSKAPAPTAAPGQKKISIALPGSKKQISIGAIKLPSSIGNGGGASSAQEKQPESTQPQVMLTLSEPTAPAPRTTSQTAPPPAAKASAKKPSDMSESDESSDVSDDESSQAALRELLSQSQSSARMET